MPRSPLIALAAGEASGDLIGAHLVAALKSKFPGARFVGIGGAKMEAAGADCWFPLEKLAVRGYVEVLRHYREITGIRRRFARALIQSKPDLFIGIDAPDFNLALERKLKRAGVLTAHYVSPSIWAWRRGRLKSIAKSVDHMLVLFPFEAELYRDAGVGVSFVGHPLADIIPEQDQTADMRALLKVPSGKKVVTLMPGSRQSELAYMGALVLKTARIVHTLVPDVHFLVPLVSRETRSQFEQAIYDENAGDLPITTLFGHGRDALAASDIALVASGTATLEAALLKKPMVIMYRMNSLTWKLMNRLRYQRWVGLPNILCGEFVVPELLQEDASAANLAQALVNMLRDDTVMERIPARLAALHQALRRDTASRVCEVVGDLLAARQRA